MPTSEGAQLFRAPAAKMVRGNDDRSGVQDDASFSTLGTESRQVIARTSAQHGHLLPALTQPISLTSGLAGTVLLLVVVRSRVPYPRFA